MTLQQRSATAQDPGEPSAALQQAQALVALLEGRNIPAQLFVAESGVALVCVYTGLVARCDGLMVSWLVPDPDRVRERPLHTLSIDVRRAADRLADHYAVLIDVPLGRLLAGGLIMTRAQEFLSDMRADTTTLPDSHVRAGRHAHPHG